MTMNEENIQNRETLPTYRQPKQPAEIKSIGKYTIETLLHTGSFSYLYLAKDPATDKLIAIKILAPSLVTKKELVDRFLLETKIITKASHANIVTVYESGTWEKGLYIAMEYIQGISLTQFIKDHSFCTKKSLEIVLKVAYGLLHLHSHKIIHRDLKPENIIIDSHGNVKIIDFGIAELGSTKKNIAFAKAPIIGTPSYMSPEQRRNPHDTHFCSDIYSLAVITYELLIGKLCYGKIYLSKVDETIARILDKALHHDYTQRTQDIVDFISDISSFLQHSKEITDHSIPLIDIQNELLPKNLPKYEDLEIGIFFSKENETPSIYYEFFHLSDNTHLIFIANTLTNNNTSFLPVINIRATIHALLHPYQRFPEKKFNLSGFLSTLNTILYNDRLHKNTNTTIIHVDTYNETLSHVTSMEESMYLLQAKRKQPHLLLNHTPPIGSSINDTFETTTDHFASGDICFIHSFSTPDLSVEEKGKLEKRIQEDLVANRFSQSNVLSSIMYELIEKQTSDSSQNFTLTLYKK